MSENVARTVTTIDTIANWAVIVTALCATVVTVLVVRNNLLGSADPARTDQDVENWSDYVTGGYRIGPEDARVTIVEFGDYQCPYCKGFELSLREVLAAYPEEVAFVYRQTPLPYHEHAYQAARLAHCAAEQGRFREAHTALFDIDDLASIDTKEFGASAAVPDLGTFVECASSEERVPRIEDDLADGQRLGVVATPTVVINGLRLARTPDFARLSELVRSELSR